MPRTVLPAQRSAGDLSSPEMGARDSISDTLSYMPPETDLPTSHPRECVVVTGAAGGIGSAVVDHFLAAGYDVLGLDLQPSVCELRSSESYVGVTADTRDELALPAALANAPSRITHLVSCAGIALPEESRAEGGQGLVGVGVFRDSVELNLTSHYAVVAACWEEIARGGGSISLCSSVNALSGFGLVAYTSAKAGLVGMMHALVRPGGARGIRVNVVAPGTTPTPATREEWAHVPGHFEAFAERVPLQRLGTPDDVAATFLALARDLCHVTGQVLAVDGGQLNVH